MQTNNTEVSAANYLNIAGLMSRVTNPVTLAVMMVVVILLDQSAVCIHHILVMVSSLENLPYSKWH